MKKKNQSTKLALNKKRISAMGNGLQDIKGGQLSVNVCPISRRNCEPSWDTACVSHLSGCDLCPTWPTACEVM